MPKRVEIPPVEPPDGSGEQACKKAKTAAPESFDIATPETASASAPADALPNDLMSMLQAMNMNLLKQSKSIDQINSRFEAQDKKIANLDHTILVAVGGLDSRFEQFKADVNDKFFALAAASQPAPSAGCAQPAGFH